VHQALVYLSHQQLERAPTQAEKVVLVRLEPGAVLLRLQLQKKLNRLVREPAEALSATGDGDHGPAVYAASAGPAGARSYARVRLARLEPPQSGALVVDRLELAQRSHVVHRQQIQPVRWRVGAAGVGDEHLHAAGGEIAQPWNDS